MLQWRYHGSEQGSIKEEDVVTLRNVNKGFLSVASAHSSFENSIAWCNCNANILATHWLSSDSCCHTIPATPQIWSWPWVLCVLSLHVLPVTTWYGKKPYALSWRNVSRLIETILKVCWIPKDQEIYMSRCLKSHCYCQAGGSETWRSTQAGSVTATFI